MLDKIGNEKIKPNPIVTRVFNALFILHADHE